MKKHCSSVLSLEITGRFGRMGHIQHREAASRLIITELTAVVLTLLVVVFFAGTFEYNNKMFGFVVGVGLVH